MPAPWEQEHYSFSGPGVAISCTVTYDREAERYIAEGSGWIGFSSRSAHDAALACFQGWMSDRGAWFKGMEGTYTGERT